MGMLGAAFGIGFVVGPAFGGLAALGGSHVPFYVAGVLATVNAVAAWVRVPETKPEGAPASARGRRRTALSPALARLALVGLVTTVAFTAFEATFALLGHHRFGFGEKGAATVFLGVGIMLVVVQGRLYGDLVKRASVNRVYVAGVALLVVGLVVTAVATVWATLIVALVLLSLGQGVASPSISTLVSEAAPPHQRGEAMGYQQSATAIGRIVGPPVAGWMFDHAGHWSPYAFGGTLCGVALVLLLSWGVHRNAAVA
jgi:MFS family permease